MAINLSFYSVGDGDLYVFFVEIFVFEKQKENWEFRRLTTTNSIRMDCLKWNLFDDP